MESNYYFINLINAYCPSLEQNERWVIAEALEDIANEIGAETALNCLSNLDEFLYQHRFFVREEIENWGQILEYLQSEDCFYGETFSGGYASTDNLDTDELEELIQYKKA